MAREEQEHGETTPRPSFAGKAFTARTSAMMSPRPAAKRPRQRSLCLSINDKKMEDKVEEPNEVTYIRRVLIALNDKKMEDKVEEPNEGTYIQRVLTDVDVEIGFLNGIIAYNTRNGRYPFYYFCCFDDFIENCLQVDVTKQRFIDVVRKLRKKYLTNMVRKGSTVDFADPRDQIAFNLAHKIWGTAQSREEDWKGQKLRHYWSRS
jgi:hypothetical protein